VLQRGEGDPFLLCYYPKTVVEIAQANELWFRTCPKLPLEIVPSKGDGAVRVLWQGKPLADAEMILLVPGQKEIVGKTDSEGRYVLPRDTAGKPGLYALRTRHVEKKAGEHDGKKYKEVRHFASMTFSDVGPEKAAPERKPD